MINSLCTSIESLHLSPPSFLHFKFPKPHWLVPNFVSQKPLKSLSLSHHNSSRKWANTKASAAAAAAAESEIDMVRTKEGIYTAKPKKVVVLWDLDNKPPRGPPYQAAMALKKVAQHFGELVDMSAYANRHAFIHLPQWVVEERRERRRMDVLERKGISTPSQPYICSVCGRKCRTHLDSKKHFRQLHERERQKKLNRMSSLKGKKRQRFKERFVDGNVKYNEAARILISPKVGYGLASELRRAGVFVKTVEDKPQAADWALKRQMQHSMSRGIDWLFLVSDDSDFSEMLRRAREANLGTVVVGDCYRALGRQADLWVPWNGVENGEIEEDDLVPKIERRMEFGGRRNGRFSVSEFDGGLSGQGSADSLMDELVGTAEFDGMRISAFSEGEEEEEEDEHTEDEQDWLRVNQRGYVQIGFRNSIDDEDDDDEYTEEEEYVLDCEEEGVE